MKNPFLLVALFITMGLQAQCNLPYKSINQCNNDTLVFYHYNFDERKECYVGKTVGDVIADIGFSSLTFITTVSMSKSGYFSGFLIYDLPYWRISHATHNHDKIRAIQIVLEKEEVEVDRDFQLNYLSNNVWSSRVQNLYKDMKVSAVNVIDRSGR